MDVDYYTYKGITEALDAMIARKGPRVHDKAPAVDAPCYEETAADRRWRPWTAGPLTASDILAKYSPEQIAWARRFVEGRTKKRLHAERKRRREAMVRAYFSRCTAAGVPVLLSHPPGHVPRIARGRPRWWVNLTHYGP